MKAAVLGAGWMGGVHAGAIAAAKDAVAVVIDADRDRAQALAATCGAEAATDPGMAAGCDVAVVATPSALHLEQATMLAATGLPLLVEKPHRLPFESAENLRMALRRGGCLYRVGLTTRFHPGLRRLRAALEEGALGRVVSYDDRYHFRLDPQTLAPWYFDRRTAGGGVVTTNGVHLIDRAGWLLGGKPRLLGAEGLVPMVEGHTVEDHARVTLDVDGVTAHLSLLWSSFDAAPPELQVIGTMGAARIGLDSWRIETADGVDAGRVKAPEAAFAAQWQAFREAVRGDGDVSAIPDLDEMERVMVIISEAYERAGVSS